MSYSQYYVNNLNSQISSLQSQVNSLNQRVQSLTSQRNSIQSKINSIQSEIKNLEIQIVDLKKTNAGGASKIIELGTVITMKKKQISQLEVQIEDHDDEITTLKRDIEQRNREIASRKATIDQQNAVTTNLEEQIVDREEQIVILQQEKKSLQLSVALKTDELNGVIDTETRTREQLEAEIAVYITRIAETGDKIRVLSEELSSIRNFVKAANKENKLYEKQLETLTSEQIHLKGLYDALRIDFDQATALIQTLRETSSRAASAFEKVMEQMKSELSKITEQYSKVTGEVARLKEEIRKLKTICPSLMNGTVAISSIDPTAQKYYVDNGILRPISETQYRDLGNPVVKSYETLENCQVGGGLVPKIEKPMYVIISARHWDDHAELKVLQLKGQTVELSPFTRAESNAWVVDNVGNIQSVLNGNFIDDNRCGVPIASSEKSPWQLIQTGAQYKFALKSRCGKFLSTRGNGLELINFMNTGFYLIPVGIVRVPVSE